MGRNILLLYLTHFNRNQNRTLIHKEERIIILTNWSNLFLWRFLLRTPCAFMIRNVPVTSFHCSSYLHRTGLPSSKASCTTAGSPWQRLRISAHISVYGRHLVGQFPLHQRPRTGSLWQSKERETEKKRKPWEMSLPYLFYKLIFVPVGHISPIPQYERILCHQGAEKGRHHRPRRGRVASRREAHLWGGQFDTPSVPRQPILVLPDRDARLLCDGVRGRRRPHDAHPRGRVHRA